MEELKRMMQNKIKRHILDKKYKIYETNIIFILILKYPK
jgi:hypothetical protein